MQKRKTFDLGLVHGLEENRHHFMGLRDESLANTVPVILSTVLVRFGYLKRCSESVWKVHKGTPAVLRGL